MISTKTLSRTTTHLELIVLVKPLVYWTRDNTITKRKDHIISCDSIIINKVSRRILPMRACVVFLSKKDMVSSGRLT